MIVNDKTFGFEGKDYEEALAYIYKLKAKKKHIHLTLFYSDFRNGTDITDPKAVDVRHTCRFVELADIIIYKNLYGEFRTIKSNGRIEKD